MAVTTKEDHMQVGAFSIDVDYSPDVLDELVDGDGWPRKVHFLIYDADDDLACYPLLLLGLPGGAEGLTATGTGPLWHLGLGPVGPMITYREYVSGADKLGNGRFLLDDLHWRRLSQGSLWVPAGGVAVNPGGLDIDDVLESDEPFGTLPGHQYRLRSTGVTGLGRWRQRVLFRGRFNPPNLLVDGGFELGPGSDWSEGTGMEVIDDGEARTGDYAMRWSPIPKPELVSNGTFEAGGGWSGGTGIAVVTDGANAHTGTGVLRCSEVEMPQYVDDPNFLLGGGAWTASEPNAGDIEVVNEPGEGLGGWTMRAGPVTQHQLFANSDMESVHAVGPRAPGAGGALEPAPVHPGPPSLAATLAHYGHELPEPSADPVVGFLRRYGYLTAHEEPDAERLEESLTEYQRFVGLEPTGVADAETLAMMARRRCAVPDRVGSTTSRWTYIGTRWEGVTNLRWHLTATGPFTQSEMAGVMVSAFSAWEACDTPLTFEETSNPSEAHMLIFWNTSPGGALAYAWQPPGPGEPLLGTNNGDITFDSADTFSLTDPPPPGAYSLLGVAMHEIGHAIGLNHSTVASAVMWAEATGNIVLDADDVTGIEAVYAGSTPPSSPGPGGTVMPYWFQSNDVDTPSEDYYQDPGGGMDGSRALTTMGDTAAPAVGVPEHKYVRADANADPTGVEAFAVKPGEQYLYQAHVRSAPFTNGLAYTSIQIPHPTVPGHDRWWFSKNLDGFELSTNMPDVWQALEISVDIPANRFALNALMEVHGHHFGYWAWDNVSCTRTRGNRAQVEYASTIPVTPGTTYRIAADVRSDADNQVGSVRVGVVLTGSGVDPRVFDADKGFTDFVWSRTQADVRVPAGYTEARPFVAALDVVGAPLWVDLITFSKVDNNVDRILGSPFAVQSDQRYLLSSVVRSGANMARGSVRVGVVLSGAGLDDVDFGAGQDATGGEWVKLAQEVRPPPGYTTATPYVQVKDTEGDYFWVDNVSFTKSDNNSLSTFTSPVSVTPERTYRMSFAVRSDAGVQRGGIRLVAHCTRPGFPPVQFESPSMGPTDGAWKAHTFTFSPPSGYGSAVPRIEVTDTEGGYFWADDGLLQDADATTVAFDTVVADPSNATVDSDVTAPEGAEEVRCMVVAAAGTSGWSVDGVSLARRGVTFATGNAIVGDLLRDPDTGEPMTIAPGTIDCPEVIPEDWEVINQTNHQALLQYCNVISDPPREFDVTASLPPTMDVGTAAGVFTDHGPASATPIVLRPSDVDVARVPPAQRDVTERATEVRLAGNERPTTGGRPRLITATSQVQRDPQFDWNQNPIRRTLNVSDGTVDHQNYAQALADDLAARELGSAGMATFTLSGERTRPPFRVGDWIYVWNREAGMEDPENPMDVEGETTFPLRLRVLSRGRSYGSSHRIVVRREDGTTFDLPGVTWSDDDTTVLTVGDRRPDWQRNASGPSAGVQYMRDRLSRPR